MRVVSLRKIVGGIAGKVHRKTVEPPVKSLHHEPYYVFDLSENFYIRYRCKTCDEMVEVSDGDDMPYTECECKNTDIWMTRGLNWCLSHEQEFWRDFKTTSDVKVPKEARKWLVGQERPMERELMEVRRWIYKKRLQQEELRNAPVVRIADLSKTLGQSVHDKGMVELEKKTYRVHFLDLDRAILEPGNFMKENPGPYILRVSEPGLGKTLASKILREEAPAMYKEAGIEATDVLTIKNPSDEQRPFVRQVPCHSIQGGGCLAPRIVQQAERGAIAEQKQKQQFIYSLLMVLLSFGAALLFTGLFIMGLYVMQVGIIAAWLQYQGRYLGYIITGSTLLFIPMFIMLIGGSRLFQANRTDMLETPHPIVQHDDKPKYVYDATVTDSATLMGSIQWNAYGSTAGLTNPLYKRVIAGLVHRAHDFIADIDEIKNMQDHTAVEMLSVMEDGESIIRNRSSGGGNTEASGILAISTSDPVPADFMLVANGNMDMIYNPNSIINVIKAFFDRFNYGDVIYYEKYIDATFANQLKIIQVIADETSRFRLYPMEKEGCQRIIEYMRERSDNNKKYKIMFRAVIKVVLKSFEIALSEKRILTTGADVEMAITKYCDTVSEQEQKELLRHTEPFKIISSKGSALGTVNGLAVIGGSAGVAFPITSEMFPISMPDGPNEYNFVVTGTVKNEDSWVADSKQHVRAAIMKMYGIDVMEHYKTFISFAEQKDVEGPSAGCAMTLSLMSLLGDPRLPEPHEGDCPPDEHLKGHRVPVPLRQDTAVTGTIQLLRVEGEPRNARTGRIGGVTYKVQGAADVGIKYVIIPQKNFEHTLTRAKYPCIIFGAENILGYFDLIRADQHNIEATLAIGKPKSTDEEVEVWSAERAKQKVGAIKEEASTDG